MGKCIYCGEEEVSIDGDYICESCQSIPDEERVQILGSIKHK